MDECVPVFSNANGHGNHNNYEGLNLRSKDDERVNNTSESPNEVIGCLSEDITEHQVSAETVTDMNSSLSCQNPETFGSELDEPQSQPCNNSWIRWCSTLLQVTHELGKQLQTRETSEDEQKQLKEQRSKDVVQTSSSLSYQSHVKSLKGIENKDFKIVVERLSERYKISNDLKDRILGVKKNETLKGERKLEDGKYCAVVVKYEDKLDLSLSRV